MTFKSRTNLSHLETTGANLTCLIFFMINYLRNLGQNRGLHPNATTEQTQFQKALSSRQTTCSSRYTALCSGPMPKDWETKARERVTCVNNVTAA